ncbi:MAG TPA: hypothetical protein ENH91_02265 [Leeuwenhoekiella sp.]|nr:hypothetical protein [Leeuwenhoekiella sp.]
MRLYLNFKVFYILKYSMFYRFSLSLLLISMLLSCTEVSKKAQHGTWFGGQIINPIGNSVILRKGNAIIAEAKLKANNRFLLEIPDFKPGLYEFLHKERQLVYLTAGDSVILRANTLEFDESLTFSGFGAAKNNFMIDLFLMNERENEQMARNAVYHESPQLFAHYLDSLQGIRNKRWQTFKKMQEAPDDFTKVAKAIINYDIYARKEVYPLTNFVPSKMQLLAQIPDDFYAYRSTISFDEEDLLPLYSYQRFLFNYFNQAAFREYGKQTPYDPHSLIHNSIELKLIDSTVSNHAIKSFLLTRCIRNYLSNSNDEEGNEQIYERYMKFIPSSTDKKVIEELYKRNQNLEAGKRVPQEKVVDAELHEHSLRALITKPTILYFWSSENRDHMIRAHNKARKLRERYPQYNILDLNIDIDRDVWLQTLENKGFEKQYSYQFKDQIDELRTDFSINNIVKTVVLDKNGLILNAHANMFSSRFESELLGYLNKTD